ncbi:MAG: polysaccharide deacetylase family protein [Pseudomonadota bacterium]
MHLCYMVREQQFPNHLMINHSGSISLKTLLSLLSPTGKRGRLSIVIYHRVLTESDLLLGNKVNSDTFDSHLGYLTRYFNILPLSEAVQRLSSGTLPSRAACVTFDDGYADNVEIALPILQKHGVPATFFIATGFINGGIMWNDKVIELIRRAPGDTLDLGKIGLGNHAISSISQRQQLLFPLIDKLKYLPFEERHRRVDQLCELVPVALPDNLMMTSEQIRKLHQAGMEIGGHTINHPILARLDDNLAFSEIANGKEMLESIIGEPVHLFAYPNGKPGQDYLLQHPAMIKKIGFKAAVSTAWGAARRSTDIYQLPRFTPWDSTHFRFALRMARNLLTTVETI